MAEARNLTEHQINALKALDVATEPQTATDLGVTPSTLRSLVAQRMARVTYSQAYVGKVGSQPGRYSLAPYGKHVLRYRVRFGDHEAQA